MFVALVVCWHITIGCPIKVNSNIIELAMQTNCSSFKCYLNCTQNVLTCQHHSHPIQLIRALEQLLTLDSEKHTFPHHQVQQIREWEAHLTHTNYSCKIQIQALINWGYTLVVILLQDHKRKLSRKNKNFFKLPPVLTCLQNKHNVKYINSFFFNLSKDFLFCFMIYFPFLSYFPLLLYKVNLNCKIVISLY